MTKLLLRVLPLLAVGCISPAAMPGYPFDASMRPAPGLFTGAGKCRARVEPLVFDEATQWNGGTEAAFVAKLKPDAQKSHEGDKPGATEAYFRWIKINERDYLADTGRVTTGTTGDEPFVVRGRVLAVGPPSGVKIVHTIYAMPANQKIAELTIDQGGMGYGLGHQIRNATMAHAMTILKFFGDRYGCTGPPRVTD